MKFAWRIAARFYLKRSRRAVRRGQALLRRGDDFKGRSEKFFQAIKGQAK